MRLVDKDKLVKQIDDLLKECNFAIEDWFANQIHIAVYCAEEVNIEELGEGVSE